MQQTEQVQESSGLLSMVSDILNKNIELGSFNLGFSLLTLLLKFILPAAFGYVIYRLLKAGSVWLTKTLELSEKASERVQRWVRFALRILYIVLLFILGGWLLGGQISEFTDKLFGLLNSPFLESGDLKISIMTLLLLIPVFYFASRGGKIARNYMTGSVLPAMGLSTDRIFSLSSIMQYIVMTILSLVGLSIIGIDLSALTVIFGVLGIGLGFGLQPVVSNFFAGLVIIFARPVKEGDRVLVNNFEGTVYSVRLLSTIVNTITNETIVVPNSYFVGQTIHNYSYDNRYLIIINKVQVSYNANLDQVLEILRGVGTDNPFSLSRKEPEARVEAFADSGIEMWLLTWIADVSDKYRALSWGNLEIWRRFKAEGVEIPFPQVDLHVKSDPKGRVSGDPQRELE